MKNLTKLLLGLLMVTTACNSPYTSKKKGYFKIDLPSHQYVTYDRPEFPYSFEYPTYGRIIQDSTYFDSTPENNYWVNVDFPSMNARLFLSYKIIGGKAPFKIKQADGGYRDSVGINQFDLMVNDAFNLTNKNDVIASNISDSLIKTPHGISGVYFKVGGNAATARQFFLSDTVHHFIRGALYFESTPNADSIKPVLEFLSKDMDHLINSFRWKNTGKP